MANTEVLKDPVAPTPCCGNYETCTQACTPRGEFIGERNARVFDEINKKGEGYMFSYIDHKFEERMYPPSFGSTKARAKRYLKAQNHLQRLEPINPYKLYKVCLVVEKEIKFNEQK